MKRSLFILFLSAGLSVAQTEPSAATIKSAEKLAVTIGLDKQLEGGFIGMLPMVNNIAKRLQLTPEATDELQEIYKKWYVEDLDQKKLNKGIITAYAETYTNEELIELNKFYQSTLGRKTLVANPEMMRKSAALSMEEAQAKQPQLQVRLQPFMEKHARPQGPAGQPGPLAPQALPK